MTFNMNQLIEKGWLDLTLDETTWPDSSYAEIHGRLNGKKTDTGGQHVLLLDAQRRHIYAWIPHHKFYDVKAPLTATGPVEVVHLVNIITPLIKGTPNEMTDKKATI